MTGFDDAFAILGKGEIDTVDSSGQACNFKFIHGEVGNNTNTFRGHAFHVYEGDKAPVVCFRVVLIPHADGHKIVMITANELDQYRKKGIPEKIIPEIATILKTPIYSSTVVEEHKSYPGEYRVPEASKYWDRLRTNTAEAVLYDVQLGTYCYKAPSKTAGAGASTSNHFGSIWRKWDLHFHTPSSHDYKDKSVTNQNIIDALVTKDVAVVAITDHHIIDVARIKDLQRLGEGKITVLPGIEFRGELGGSESIHFIGIFSENCELEDVWTKLQTHCGLTRTDIASKGGDEKIYCDIKDTCNHIHNLGGLVTVHAGGKSNTLESIRNNQEFKRALKIDLVRDYLDIFELGKEHDQEDYDNIVFPAINIRRPMIICSDNHDIKNYSVKQNLWIKADATFDGLKQITFEPEFRIHIGELAPIPPPIRIDKVTLDFAPDSTLNGDAFCLSGKNEITLSPHYTCFIGGRGTGKSTLLNLINEKLKPLSNKSFSLMKIKDGEGKVQPLGDRISVDDNSDEKYVEFISQNEVENFAKEYGKLTAAIYSRILKSDEEGAIVKLENAFKEKFAENKTNIENIQKARQLRLDLEQKERELSTNKKIIDSFTSTEYTNLSQQVKDLSDEAGSIVSSEEKHSALKKELALIVENYKPLKTLDLYAQETDKIVSGIEGLISASNKMDFSEVQKKVVKLSTQLTEKRTELKLYLSGKGLTAENLKDISAANAAISALESDIQKRKNEIDIVQRKIDTFDKKGLEESKSAYVKELEKQIATISSVLEKLENSAVKPISLRLDFDLDSAHDRIFEEFLTLFKDPIQKTSHKYKGENVLRDILFSVPPESIHTKNKEEFQAEILSHSSVSAAKVLLSEIFSDDTNWKIQPMSPHLTA